eukprot:3447247-Prymnesium_polylepis.1
MNLDEEGLASRLAMSHLRVLQPWLNAQSRDSRERVDASVKLYLQCFHGADETAQAAVAEADMEPLAALKAHVRAEGLAHVMSRLCIGAGISKERLTAWVSAGNTSERVPQIADAVRVFLSRFNSGRCVHTPSEEACRLEIDRHTDGDSTQPPAAVSEDSLLVCAHVFAAGAAATLRLELQHRPQGRPRRRKTSGVAVSADVTARGHPAAGASRSVARH